MQKCRRDKSREFYYTYLRAINAFNARNELDKVIIVGESNNTGSGGGTPSRRRQTEVRGRSPQRWDDFDSFFKKYAFL